MWAEDLNEVEVDVLVITECHYGLPCIMKIRHGRVRVGLSRHCHEPAAKVCLGLLLRVVYLGRILD
jgi:hypothetical protein